ncbi:MAG: TrbC/VirB2 family protein [Fibrobacter sp.]|nr:TrbC/VirB2 family protein [Fibrobacter sp.]
MQKLQDFLDKLPDTIKPIATGLAIVCLVIAGVMFMLGRKKREEGKEVAMGAIEGVLIVSLATSLVSWLVAFLA